MQLLNKDSIKSINLNGDLTELNTPLVMGILNITPDSFYSKSRYNTEDELIKRIEQIITEGGSIIDIGAYSSRPGALDVSADEELKRLTYVLSLINKYAPQAVVSIDTFRAPIAKRCVKEYGAAIINDISAGELDKTMFETIAELNVPYIIMHMRGTPQTMMQHISYENIIKEMILYFASKINKLKLLGINDIIIDPGFGFSKTPNDNFHVLNHLSEFQVLDQPILTGISRKSMIHKTLKILPDDSLNGTTVLNTLSILCGANILRVHDVKEAVETVKLVTTTLNS